MPKGAAPRRRSLLVPTAFSLAAFCLFLALGTWQVERLHWKEGLIAAREASMAAPPAALPKTLDAARTLDLHRVRAEGVFRNEAELYRTAIATDGKPGFHVMTPLALADGDTVLVDRGFVPEDKRAPASRPAGQVQGRVAVVGLLHLPPAGNPSAFIPDNSPATNRWFYVDLPAMAAADHLDKPLPFYVEADATPNPGGWPRGGQFNIALPNDHLQYAITWFALAALMPILYLFLMRHLRRESGR